MEVVEGQGGDSRRGEVLFVLRQHHLVRGPETVREYHGRVRPRAVGQGEPCRAALRGRDEIRAGGGDGGGHRETPS